MVEPHVRRRVYGAGVAILVTAGLLLARLAVAPSAEGFRHAMAAAPGGQLYTVTSQGALLAGGDGSVRPLGRTPPGLPLALAVDGSILVLGSDRGVAVSTDSGVTWRAAAVPAGRYPAVWVSGRTLLAGQWAGHVWASDDAGAGWRSLGAPGGGEYQAMAEAGGSWYVATLLGVWTTADRGRLWEATALPSRVTALEGAGAALLAGDWRGDVYSLRPGGRPARVARLGAGIWALEQSLVATTDGVRGGPRVLLAGREVSALVSAGDRLYAGIAGGPVLVSGDRGASWRTAVQG